MTSRHGSLSLHVGSFAAKAFSITPASTMLSSWSALQQ